MSMPNFKKADPNRHDFSNKGGKLFTDMDDGTGMIAAKYDVSSIQDDKTNDGPMDTIQEHVRSKQNQILQNPQLRTSMTTNIRNIMRNQDKGLLTTSTRLLNASVRNQEFKGEIRKQSLSRDTSPQQAAPKGKAISTVELLQRSKNPN